MLIKHGQCLGMDEFFYHTACDEKCVLSREDLQNGWIQVKKKKKKSKHQPNNLESNHTENTNSQLITEVKQCQDWLVLRWGTA